MEKNNFKIIGKSAVKPLYIERCDDIHGHVVYRRRYQRRIFVFHHIHSECYYTIHYTGAEKFSYERLLEYIIDVKPQLDTLCN